MLGRLKRFAWQDEGSSLSQCNRGSSADGQLQCAPESLMGVLELWCSVNGTALCRAASEGCQQCLVWGLCGLVRGTAASPFALVPCSEHPGIALC